MFKRFAAAALVGAALVVPSTNAIAQHHHHGHGHGHFGHGHLGHGHFGHNHFGHHHHGHGSIYLGGLGLGYWPSYYNYYPSYSSWNVGWPYYGSYSSYPSAYYIGSWPTYWGAGVNFSLPTTTFVNVQNAAAPNAMANAAAPANNVVAARPVDIQFGGFAQFGELSTRLVQQANELCLDLHHNYQQNDGFADTYRAAYQIFDTAKFATTNQGDRPEIARRVNEVDALFHQVRADVRHFRRRSVQRIAGTSLQTKLNEVEATLHDLMTDIGVMGTHGAPPPAAPLPAAAAPANVQVAPPPLPQLPPPNPPLGAAKAAN